MANIKITCDSACDLPKGLAKRYRIDCFPLGIRPSQKAGSIAADGRATDTGVISGHPAGFPKVVPLTAEDYRKAFEAYTAMGLEIIHIGLSSEISRCCCSAWEAAKDFKNVHIIDSRSISAGTGQLALLAAELASADYHAEEIVEALEDMKKRMEVSFVLQSPDRFCRCASLRGLPSAADRFFKRKPEIMLKKGVFHRERAFRGDMESTILAYVRKVLEGRKNIQTDRIFVTYSQVPRNILNQVIELLKQLQPFEEILEAPADPVFSGFCGTGCLGLSFLTD